jgi:hypothetical protein
MKMRNLGFATMAAAAIVIGASASASALTITNAPATGSIGGFGFPDTQTYGEVFTSPVTGTLTSFTMSLDGGVGPAGALTGNVGSWNGPSTFALGFGSPTNLFTSAPVGASAGGSFTFTSNVSVVAGQNYVTYISIFGVPGATTSTTMPTTGASVANFDYFVWNNTTDPNNNPSWNYFANFGNAVVTLDFAAPGPTPGAGLASLAALALLVGAAKMRRA